VTRPKLTYFDAPTSRGEECRLALHLAGIDFEDNRISQAAWPALKEQTPYGQLPVLELPGQAPFAQTNPILVLIGRRHGLHPTDDVEAARHEAMMQHVEEAAQRRIVRIAQPLAHVLGDVKRQWSIRTEKAKEPDLKPGYLAGRRFKRRERRRHGRSGGRRCRLDRLQALAQLRHLVHGLPREDQGDDRDHEREENEGIVEHLASRRAFQSVFKRSGYRFA